MFKISKKARKLTKEEQLHYKRDGYITGLPVFDAQAKDDLNELFVSLSSRLSNDIDIKILYKIRAELKSILDNVK